MVVPKMIERSHAAMIHETAASEDIVPHDVRRLFCLPIFHGFSFPEMVINALRLGWTCYMMRRLDDTFSQKIESFRITEIMTAPPVLLKLCDQVLVDPTEKKRLRSLRKILCGGAPLSAGLRSRTLSILDTKCHIAQVWGMSEGGWFATFKWAEHDATGSVGRAMPGLEVKESENAADTDGHPAFELLVRGPQLARRYLGNQAATTESFSDDGWMRTGDVGFVAADGKIYLVDRSKDLIKVNGWSVSPAELEAALHKDPENVVDVGVVGVGWGLDERPVAFVVPRKSVEATSTDEIKDRLLTHCARYKAAKCEIRFTTEIPKNPSGKVLRKVLRQWYEQAELTA